MQPAVWEIGFPMVYVKKMPSLANSRGVSFPPTSANSCPSHVLNEGPHVLNEGPAYVVAVALVGDGDAGGK